jgi:hypothetical protein
VSRPGHPADDGVSGQQPNNTNLLDLLNDYRLTPAGHALARQITADLTRQGITPHEYVQAVLGGRHGDH